MTKATIEKIDNGWILCLHYGMWSNELYCETFDEALKNIEKWRQHNSIEREIAWEEEE